jgi:Gluconate 2-dehydrogenase subunit 3
MENLQKNDSKNIAENNWSRRDLLKTIALLTGGAVIGGSLFMQGCKSNGGKALNLSPAMLALLDEIGETIIPTTDTAGAKAAQIGKFMNTMVSDCYTSDEQKTFSTGINGFEDACKKLHTKSFTECTAEQRKTFLVSLEKEAKDYDKKIDEENKKEKEAAKAKGWQANLDFKNKPRHYYSMLKQLTLMGYFSSEIGMTKAKIYTPVPTKYDGAYPYKAGDKLNSYQ